MRRRPSVGKLLSKRTHQTATRLLEMLWRSLPSILRLRFGATRSPRAGAFGAKRHTVESERPAFSALGADGIRIESRRLAERQ
jgi:hypothetical protein